MWKLPGQALDKDVHVITALMLEWPSEKPQLAGYIGESSPPSPEDVPGSGIVRGAGGSEFLLLGSDQQLLGDHRPGCTEWLHLPFTVRDHGFKIRLSFSFLPSPTWASSITDLGRKQYTSKQVPDHRVMTKSSFAQIRISLSSFQIMQLRNISNIQKAQRIMKQIPMYPPQRVNNC